MFHRNNTLRAQNENKRNHSKIMQKSTICPKNIKWHIKRQSTPTNQIFQNRQIHLLTSSTRKLKGISFCRHQPYQHSHPWLARKSTNPMQNQKTLCFQLCYLISESLAGKGTIASLFTLEATCKISSLPPLHAARYTTSVNHHVDNMFLFDYKIHAWPYLL